RAPRVGASEAVDRGTGASSTSSSLRHTAIRPWSWPDWSVIPRRGWTTTTATSSGVCSAGGWRSTSPATSTSRRAPCATGAGGSRSGCARLRPLREVGPTLLEERVDALLTVGGRHPGRHDLHRVRVRLRLVQV